MAKSGDVLEHPITGERFVIRKSAAETQGELTVFDFTLKPGGFVAAEHIHPLQEESFEVVAGVLKGRFAGRELTAGPGEKVVAAAGTPHAWWNQGDTELHVLVEFRPALRSENFFETFFGLAQDGKVSPKTGLPNLLQMALVLREYRDEIRLARPPQLVQTVVFGVLAPVGRLLGYKGEYPYPRREQPDTQAA